MQQIKIAQIDVKEGDNKKGHWVNYLITGEDKSKAGTFDHAAASLKVGDIIEVEIELSGKYANIKSFKKVSATPPPEEYEVYEVSPEEIAEHDSALKRKISSKDDNIAEAVAFKGAVDLLCSKIIPISHPHAARVTAFIEKHLHLPPERDEKPQTSTEKPVEEETRVEPPKQAKKGFIEEGWLKEQLDILQAKKPAAWGEASLLSYIRKTYKVEGKTSLEMAAKLDEGSAKHFVKSIQDALGRGVVKS